MLYHDAMRSRNGNMICIGSLEDVLGGGEVLVGMSEGSIIYFRVPFLDVTVPIEGKCTQLATNSMRTFAQTSHPQLPYFKAVRNSNIHVL